MEGVVDRECGSNEATKQGSGRWGRDEVAKRVLAFKTHGDNGISQREFCKIDGISRATLQGWLDREASLTASPEAVAFFECPAGLAHLHRVQVACALCNNMLSPAGVRIICLFLELSGLNAFIASSYGAQYNYIKELHTKLDEYSKEQRDKGTEHLKQVKSELPFLLKQIILLMDENFHEGPCLVATDAASNFIFTEQHSEARDEAAWTEAMRTGLADLPVQVVAANTDEAKALKAYTTKTLDVPHLCELFHVQQEVTKGTSASLARRERDSQKALDQAIEKKGKVYARWESIPADSGESYVEGPVLQQALEGLEADVEQARQALQEASSQRQQMREAVRELSSNYHPYDLETGHCRSQEQVEAGLTGAFDKMERVASEAGLAERFGKSLKKARRLLESMVATVAFFHCLVAARLHALKLDPKVEELVANILIPMEYLNLAAGRCSQAEGRHQFLETVRQMGERLAADALWTALPESYQRDLLLFSRESAHLFVRSTSAVEGRNGQLSLHHHGSHHLSKAKLTALTVVHNYFLLRGDGTTASERFFGRAPDDMFQWLLEHMPLPSRPAKPRSHHPWRQAA